MEDEEEELPQPPLQWQNVEERAQRWLLDAVTRAPSPTALSALPSGLSATTVPRWLSDDRRTIDVSYKNFTSLPADLLSYLRLLPSGAGAASPSSSTESVTHLDLSCNSLSALDADLGASPLLRTLQCLDLRANLLTRLPGSMKCLTALTTLNLGSNQLSELEDDMFLHTPALSTLSLSSNFLTRLPDSITTLQSLSSLICNYNRITHLPEGFASALGGTLTTLRLADNRLLALPEDFSTRMLPSLQHLDLTNNPDLVSLPFLDLPECYPTRAEIFTSIPQRVMENLFIGDMTVGLNQASLLHHKITHILMVLENEPAPYPQVFTYKRIELSDDERTDLLEVIPHCCTFIEEGMAKGGVLVHCAAGISRSATVVLAYMMQRLGISFETALERLKRVRSVVDPNRGFRKQLLEWQNRCTGSSTLP